MRGHVALSGTGRLDQVDVLRYYLGDSWTPQRYYVLELRISVVHDTTQGGAISLGVSNENFYP